MADSEMDDEVGVIRPIEQESIRRIVAGQAVSDLASAVKELVDNSLDAGSKSINSKSFSWLLGRVAKTLWLLFCFVFIWVAYNCVPLCLLVLVHPHASFCTVPHYVLKPLPPTRRVRAVRLFNQGLDIVEVSDDGCGVPVPSRPFLAHPSATSKIRSFEDIYNHTACTSLGFRGEALFCLANLSEKLVVATRTCDEYVAQKMEFGHDGALVPDSVTPTPRKTGTTVAVLKLLHSLPVRRADMERRIVQHRSKMMRLMEGCKLLPFFLGCSTDRTCALHCAY